MSYMYNTNKYLDNGGYDTTGFNEYSLAVQTNNGVLPTTNYYNDDKQRFCNYESEFNDQNRIMDCIDCVSNYGFYGDEQIYCNGKCMNKYSLGQICSDGSLVARNVTQCFKPCYSSFPSTFGTQLCKNNKDCNVNEICNSTGFCETNPYIIDYNAGMTGMTGMKESFTPKKGNMFIGVF